MSLVEVTSLSVSVYFNVAESIFIGFLRKYPEGLYTEEENLA